MSRPHEPMSGFSTTGYPSSSIAASADSGVNATRVRGLGTPSRMSRIVVRSTPTRGLLFTPVLFGLWSESERERGRLLHLELRAAIRAGDDLAFDGIRADGDLGIAFGALRHGPILPELRGEA